MEEAPPTHHKDAQVIWSGNEALQLPKISGRQGFNRRPCRRSDFTEIEIPAVPPQFTPANDLYTPTTNSSYQLFPDKNPSPLPKRSSNASLQYQERTSQPRDKYQGKNVVKDSILPEKNLRNLYMNHSAIIREETRQDQHPLLPERTKPVRAAKVPSPFPYIPTHLAHCPTVVPWMVEQQPPGPTGDNSLTALQIAKSLSEVDFFPSEQRGPSVPSQRPSYRNGPSLHGDGCYSWEKEVRQPLAQRHLIRISFVLSFTCQRLEMETHLVSSVSPCRFLFYKGHLRLCTSFSVLWVFRNTLWDSPLMVGMTWIASGKITWANEIHEGHWSKVC